MPIKTSAVAKIDRSESILSTYTNEQIAVIKQNVAKDATDYELIYFLQVCKAQNLDPFAKQIYFVKRQGVMTIQTGIDGYRAIADQTGKLAGSDDPIFDTEKEKHPNKATVTVHKLVGKAKVPFTASARWLEYYPGDKMGFMWNKMPYLMLGKVAEALALRKAFPKNLGNIYTEEEMQGADNVQAVESNADQLREVEVEDVNITSNQKIELHQELARTGKKLEDLLAHLKKEKISDLTFQEAKTWIISLKAAPAKEDNTSSTVDNGEPELTDELGPVEGEIIEEMPEEEPKPKPGYKGREAMEQGLNNRPVAPTPAPAPVAVGESPIAKKMREAKEAGQIKAKEIRANMDNIPEDVCKFINYYEGVPETDWPEGLKELKADCNAGQFKGKEHYQNLF